MIGYAVVLGRAYAVLGRTTCDRVMLLAYWLGSTKVSILMIDVVSGLCYGTLKTIAGVDACSCLRLSC